MSSKESNIPQLIALAKSQWKILSVATIFLFASSGLSLLFPTLIGKMIDQIQIEKGDALASINSYILLLFILFFFMGIATFFRSYLFTVAGERVVASLRKDLSSGS